MKQTIRGDRSWLAFWALVFLALMVRLSIGSLVLPQIALDDPVLQLAKLSTLCDSQSSDHGTPDQHRPTDVGGGTFILGDALETLTLASIFVIFVLSIQIFTISFWCFPPVRGPPLRQLSGLFPQGPPV